MKNFKEIEKKGLEVNWIIFKINTLSDKWYFNAEKLWKKINIDEKNIWNNVYTIISNPDLWVKWLVWIIAWVKAKTVEEFIMNNSTEKQRNVVKEISMDMANTMKHIATEVFPKAIQVVDRFHVMQNVLEDMIALISKVKTEIKKDYLEEQENAKIERRKPKYTKYKNEETLLEIITRWRFQLLQRRKDWNETQILRWECFETIPQLQNISAMYKQIEKIFEIYDNKYTIKEARNEFNKWFSSISKLHFITELQNTWRMIKNHFERILNYFNSRLTNWYAEWLNSRIQKIISNSRWFKNQNYMIYRMIKIFG